MARDPSEWRVDSVPLIPLANGPFSLQLALAEPVDGDGEPFVVLSEDGDFARELLALIKGNDDTIVDYCSVKLTRSSYRALGQEVGSLSNSTVESEWTREVERIRDFRSASKMAPRLISPASADNGMLPPLFFCRKGRLLFVPPCPRCGGSLKTCRDDALLATVGLPLFGSSLERFLYCKTCNKDDPQAPFYAFELLDQKENDRLRSSAELFRDLGEGLAGASDGQHADFPCPDCVEAARKFRDSVASGLRTAPFWEDRWSVLSFHDSPYLVTGIGAVSLDEIADVFAGRPPEAFADRKISVPALALSSRFRYRVGDDRSDAQGRLFFGAASSGLDAAEVLYLKVVAFGQAVEAALEYARTFGRPHLNLHPRHFQFDFSRAGDDLPWLWAFRVHLNGLSSGARPERIAGGVEVLVPPGKASVPYAAPELLEFHLSPARPAQLIVHDLESVGQSSTWRLHGRLSDSYGIYPDPQPNDWIHILVRNDALGLSDLAMPARRDPRVQPAAQELAFITEPVSFEEPTLQKLRNTAGGRITGARYRVYADFGIPSDLYSLGVMLLRLLVGNDARDVRAIAQVAERFANSLRSNPEVDPVSLLAKGDLIGAALNKSNVFYQEVDRVENRPNAIPDAIWNRAILLGLRLASRVEGFSICLGPSDYDVSHPTGKLESTLQEVRLLASELRALLFQRQAVHLEIQQVLSEISAQGGAVAATGRSTG